MCSGASHLKASTVCSKVLNGKHRARSSLSWCALYQKPPTCKEVDGEGMTATKAVLEAGEGAVPTDNNERESSVMRLPDMAANGWVALAAGVDATKDAGAEDEVGPKQLESGSAAGTYP